MEIVKQDKFKVLVVDDRADNLRFLSRLLVEEGYQVQSAISGKIALMAALNALPDLILLDVVMPEMDGYQLCAQFKSQAETKDIPIIFLSGLNDIAEKVKAFEAGGADYITKPFHAEEILLRIHYQLAIQQLQKQLKAQNEQLKQEISIRTVTETALRESESKYRALVESALDIIWLLDPEGRYSFVNPAVKQIYGYEPEEMIGRFFTDFLPIEQVAQDRAIFEQLLAGKSVFQYETMHLAKDGSPIYLMFNAIALQNEAGEVVGITGTANNINERKRAEEKLRKHETKLAAAQRVAHVGNWEYELSTHQITWSEEIFRILGLEVDSVKPTYPQLLKFIHPSDRALFHRSVYRAMNLASCYKLDFRIVRPNGQVRYVEVRGEAILNKQGQVVRLFGTTLDITARKQAEDEIRLLLATTQAISEVTEIESALAPILRSIGTTTGWDVGEAWLPTENGEVLRYKSGWYRRDRSVASHVRAGLKEFQRHSATLAFTPGTGLLGRVWQTQQPEWIDQIEQASDPLFLRSPIATQVGLKVGFIVPILVSESPSHEKNRVLAILAFFKRSQQPKDERAIDLVKAVAAQLGSSMAQKMAEAAHRLSEERLQLALAGSALGLWDWNIATGQTYYDPQWKKILGYEVEEIQNHYQAWEQLLHPEDAPGVLQALRAYLEGCTPSYEVEFRMKTKSGEWKWIAAHGKVSERDALGNPLRMTGTNKDISDRKQVELELRAVSKRLKYLLTSSPAAIYSFKASGDCEMTFMSNNVTSLLGYKPQEFLADTRFWTMRIHPEDRQRATTRMLNLLTVGYYADEYRFLHADGTYRWLYDQLKLIRDSRGNPLECVGYWIDISDRKQTELALRESQRRYKTLTEAAPVGIFHTDAVGNCVYVNRRWSEIAGHSIESALGTGWTNPLHPDDRDRLFAEWAFAAEARLPLKSEYRILHPDGKIVWAIAQALAEIGDDGEIIGYVGTITDITERKLAEEALQDNAERERAIAKIVEKMRQTLDIQTIFATTTAELRSAIECDRVAIYRFNPDWSGKFVAESVGSHWKPLVCKLDDDTLTSHPTTTCNKIPDLVLDTYLQSTNGGVYNQGKTCIVVTDIYQAQLSECYRRLLESFQATAYIIVPIFCGNKLWGLLATYQNSGSRQWKTVETNMVVQIGNQLGVAVQQAELFTQTQRQSIALQHAVLAADAANRAKSEFLANMSHELRTPLNAILGFTQMIGRDKSLTPELQENLGIINRAGEHLLKLINDILEMSKIEAGKTTLTPNSFNLNQLLDNLEQMLRLRAESKGLQLIFEKPSTSLPQYIKTDEGKLRQVLINLLGNAIKFTQSGGISLRVKQLEDDDLETPTLRFKFEIEDTGYGIAPEELNLLFEAFSQTETGRKSQQGTGLGLPISRKYVQLMGGDIQVSSILGQGSIFSFEIQAQLADETDIQPPHNSRKVIGLAPGQPEYRILVVDDRSEGRLLLFKYLSSLGFLVREAENGLQAIAVWERWQPHLIWMDMRMPVMDGYEATQQIKTKEREKQVRREREGLSSLDGTHLTVDKTVIIALTASAFEDQRKSILLAGCDDFVPKPFREEKLLEKLQQHLNVRYLYTEDSNPTSSTHDAEFKNQPKEVMLTATDLRQIMVQMPPDWVKQIHDAAAQCSDDLILELLEQVPPENSVLKKSLRDLANNFQFEIIMKSVEQDLV